MTKEDNKQESKQDELLTPDQACQFLNLKRSMLSSLVFKNQIPVIRLGRCLRFSKSDLTQWISQKKNYSL